MEALALHNGAPTVHLEDNIRCVYVVEVKIFTPRFKYIDIPVYLIQGQFTNGVFVPKYENYSVMPQDMCTKTCSVLIISWITNRMNRFRLYPSNDS